MADTPTVVPDWYDDRDINFAEIIAATELPSDSVRGWHALLQAAGLPFGKKFRSTWMFSARELYGFVLASALRRLGYPVNANVLKAIHTFITDQDVPAFPFTLTDEGLPAVVLVDAPVIHAAVIEMLAGMRALEEVGADG